MTGLAARGDNPRSVREEGATLVDDGPGRNRTRLAGARRQEHQLFLLSVRDQGPLSVGREVDRVVLAEEHRRRAVRLAQVGLVDRKILFVEKDDLAVVRERGRKRPVEPGQVAL